MKPVPSLRRQHGSALTFPERVTMVIWSFTHAGSVIAPVWAPTDTLPAADASKKDTALKSARKRDGPSAIHSAELLAASADVWVVENELLRPDRDGQRAVPLAETSADTVSPGLTFRGMTFSGAGNISHHAK